MDLSGLGVPYQGALLKLMIEDPNLWGKLRNHLKPNYFENEVHQWVYAQLEKYFEKYGRLPDLGVLRSEAFSTSQLHVQTVDALAETDLTHADWIKTKVQNFIKDNMSAQLSAKAAELWNSDRRDAARELNAIEAPKIHAFSLSGGLVDYAADHDRRRAEIKRRPDKNTLSTGLSGVDKALDGGLAIGELGVWIANTKVGKSIMLVYLAKAALVDGLNVFFAVGEGRADETKARLDASLSGALYSDTRSDRLTWEDEEIIRKEAARIGTRIQFADYTTGPNSQRRNVPSIVSDIKTLEAEGWQPDLVVVDYGDLFTEDRFRTEVERQKQAFQALKDLANDGYAVWTAAQSRRLEKAPEDYLVSSKDIADCYDKVRVADFIASINRNKIDKQYKQARLFLELCRRSMAPDSPITVAFDPATMQLGDEIALTQYQLVPLQKPVQINAPLS